MSMQRAQKVEYVTHRELANPDLSVIHRALPPDNSMRHVPVQQLQDVYQAGRAAVMLVNDAPAGFVKLTERPDKQRSEQIGIGANTPKILELGGSIVLEEFRGQSLYVGLNRKILEAHEAEIKNRNVLIIGCTVTIPFLLSFGKGIPEGMDFKVDTIGYFHQSHPLLASLMCSCDPEDRYQDIFRLRQCPADPASQPTVINTASSVVVAHDQREIYAVTEPGALLSLRDGTRPTQTSCAMTFISDVALGHEIEASIYRQLGLRAGDVDSFRHILRGTGYYGTPSE